MTLPADPAGMIRVGQSGGYFCRSASTPGAWWFIWGEECSCPATVARCKHLKMVQMFVAALNADQARPAVPINRSLMCD